ncbi:MAG: hypothetical protein II995_02605, partial [Oscillospiraceae bacterium]|nr:hypothetical protein [Oscillospiraceae bacterium]
AGTTFDVFVMVTFGLIGFMLRRLDFPIPPFVIGLVLGELAEVNLPQHHDRRPDDFLHQTVKHCYHPCFRCYPPYALY